MDATAQANERSDIRAGLARVVGERALFQQPVCDDIPTFWVGIDDVREVLRYLQRDVEQPYRMLYDLTAIDERVRSHRQGLPPSDYTVVYHLLSFERNEDIRVKVALSDGDLALPTITDLWPAANWYEREVWDMF